MSGVPQGPGRPGRRADLGTGVPDLAARGGFTSTPRAGALSPSRGRRLQTGPWGPGGPPRRPRPTPRPDVKSPPFLAPREIPGQGPAARG